MASDEEDDYMSEAILAGVPTEMKRSSTYSERRKQQLQSQQQRGYNKPKDQAEREAREEGLASHIPEDNKGFQMLTKMGYKKGEALGPSSSNPSPNSSMTPLTTPIPIHLKHDRLGLGIPSTDPTPSRKRKAELETQTSAELDEEQDDFRHKKNQEFELNQIRRDVKNSRITCEQLDLRMGWERNEFWISKPPEEVEKEEDGTEGSGGGGLGTAVKGDVDVRGEQGEKVEYEREVMDIEDDDDDSDGLEDKLVHANVAQDRENIATPFQELEPPKQLEQVTTYLRNKHFYCLWCGCAYRDADELKDLCQGPTRDDHDDV
ncbi:hypothetical protein HK097_000153 [Rhizophlyctis rosea]|uniref:G-patch domain-containing protein n=1 Tax=Rhizophlyctis rosea TaxID=64517 RepID=A0AAD5S8J2_9FUNG|nr:hypothetical protein HK097_000153 [Rhizophlyctis rosea]